MFRKLLTGLLATVLMSSALDAQTGPRLELLSGGIPIIPLSCTVSAPCLYFANVTEQPVLTVLQTVDGKTFTGPVRSTCVASSAMTVTPSALYRNGQLWLVANTLNTFGLNAQQLYLELWPMFPNGLVCNGAPIHINFSSAIGSGASAAVWSPQWFVDPFDNSVHLYAPASADQSSDLGFSIYVTHPTDTSGFTTWSNPAAITGNSLPTDMIDPQVLCPNPPVAGCLYLLHVLQERDDKVH